MADSAVEKTETVAPVEKEVAEKPASTEEVADDDSKQSENGDVPAKNSNGKAPAKDDDVDDDEEESKDGEAQEEPTVDAHDACPVKRKSTAGDAPEGAPVEGASPEKKAKLDSADNGATTEENGAEAKVAA